MNANWIIDFVSAIKMAKLECSYDIFTNATLLEDLFIEFAKTNNFKFYVSVYGGYDEYKGKLFINEVNNGVRKLISAGIIPYGRMVYRPNNQESLINLVKHHMNLGLTILSFTLPWGIKLDNLGYICFQEQLKEFAHFYIDQILKHNFQYVGVHPIVGYISKWILNEAYHEDQCAAGKSMCSVSTNGDLYPCHCFNNIIKFKCGDLSKDYQPLFLKNFY